MHRGYVVRAWVTLILLPAFGLAQGPPASNPQAILIARQAIAALTGGASLTDITLQANVTYTAGSDTETGTATLAATARNESRVRLNLSDGVHEWIRQGQAGAWSGPDGQAHAMALHNGWIDAAWFYPALSLEAALSDPTISISLAGQKTVNGQAVEDVFLSRTVSGQSASVTAEIRRLSTVHLLVDTATFRPVELDFNLHPDHDTNRDIPVEIEFSDYRPTGRVLAPFHIQQFLQHSLWLDLQVSGVAVNSGLADGEFQVPATSGGAQ